MYLYNVIQSTDGKSNDNRLLEWTTEPPTKEGWYWVFWHHPNSDSPHIKYVNEELQYHDTLPYDDEGVWRPVKEYLAGHFSVSWLGPLPQPEMPKG